MRTALIAVVWLAGCYNPSFQDCQVTCASGNGCPSDLECRAGMCRLPGSGPACGTVAIDGPGSNGDAMRDAPMCWSIQPTNYDPCVPAFPTNMGVVWSITGPATIDTDLGNVTMAAPSTNPFCSSYTFAGVTYCLAHVQQFNVGPNAVVTVRGATPLLIVADGDMMIQGTIDGSNAAAIAGCPGNGMNGSAVGMSATGGSGGGFGSPGGNGGLTNGSAQTPAGPMFPGPTLIPLSLGCAGGNGGSGGALSLGGARGNGGAAIELSAKGTITVSGVILANGGAGSGGMVMTGTSGSGGGGGSGGSVLIEGLNVNVTMSAAICACGAGGGEGAGSAAGSPGNPALICSPGTGGSGSGAGDGGNGAGNTLPTSGGAGSGSGASGGGGGGGAGRIRIRGGSVSNSGTVVPTAAS